MELFCLLFLHHISFVFFEHLFNLYYEIWHSRNVLIYLLSKSEGHQPSLVTLNCIWTKFCPFLRMFESLIFLHLKSTYIVLFMLYL